MKVGQRDPCTSVLQNTGQIIICYKTLLSDPSFRHTTNHLREDCDTYSLGGHLVVNSGAYSSLSLILLEIELFDEVMLFLLFLLCRSIVAGYCSRIHRL